MNNDSLNNNQGSQWDAFLNDTEQTVLLNEEAPTPSAPVSNQGFQFPGHAAPQTPPVNNGTFQSYPGPQQNQQPAGGFSFQQAAPAENQNTAGPSSFSFQASPESGYSNQTNYSYTPQPSKPEKKGFFSRRSKKEEAPKPSAGTFSFGQSAPAPDAGFAANQGYQPNYGSFAANLNGPSNNMSNDMSNGTANGSFSFAANQDDEGTMLLNADRQPAMPTPPAFSGNSSFQSQPDSFSFQNIPAPAAPEIPASFSFTAAGLDDEGTVMLNDNPQPAAPAIPPAFEEPAGLQNQPGSFSFQSTPAPAVPEAPASFSFAAAGLDDEGTVMLNTDSQSSAPAAPASSDSSFNQNAYNGGFSFQNSEPNANTGMDSQFSFGGTSQNWNNDDTTLLASNQNDDSFSSLQSGIEQTTLLNTPQNDFSSWDQTQTAWQNPGPFGEALPAPGSIQIINTGSGASFTFAPSNVLIGRSKVCDMKIEGINVSRQHAWITWEQNENAWALQDMSANGTYLNGELIDAAYYVLLKDGDTVQFADSDAFQIKLF